MKVARAKCAYPFMASNSGTPSSRLRLCSVLAPARRGHTDNPRMCACRESHIRTPAPGVFGYVSEHKAHASLWSQQADGPSPANRSFSRVEPSILSEDTQLCFKHRNLGHGGGQPRISMPIPWHDYDQKDNCDGKNACTSINVRPRASRPAVRFLRCKVRHISLLGPNGLRQARRIAEQR